MVTRWTKLTGLPQTGPLGWVLLVEGICATWGTPTATNIAIGNDHLWMIHDLPIRN